MSEPVIIKAQPGKQEMFLSSSADICIFGGGAGGGKSWALLLEPLRHVSNPNFGAVIFRRTSPQITAEGGLWDTADTIYPKIGAIPRSKREWLFPSGAVVSFSHLQHEKTKYDWQGSQVPLIMFDELTHFTWTQFTYLMSRNRSTCGVRPYIRATCNPDPDHWLRKFIDWWIGDDGFPIAERSGKVRWMATISGEIFWADTKGELEEIYGNDIEPLSVTFIPSLLADNPALLAKDPGYRAKLKALPKHERDQLEGGNWDARASAGNFFQRRWVNMIEAAPVNTKWVRYWDRAATEPNPSNPDPDYTAGCLVGRTPEDRTIIGDMVHFRGTPFKVEQAIKNTASQDGRKVEIGLEQEPGASGKSEGQYMVKALNGYRAKLFAKRTKKEQDWGPLSSQAEAGNVDIVRGDWNEAFFREMEGLPDGSHDDQADAASGAYNMLFGRKTTNYSALGKK